MEKLQILPRGITTSSTHEAGDSFNLVNLRPKNGTLQPVTPRVIVTELDAYYDRIFNHQLPSGQSILIGTSGNSVYSDIDNSATLESDSLPGPSFAIEQIGNIISILCEDSICYMVWNGTSYNYLGQLPDIPVIEFKGVNAATDISGTYASEYGAGTTTLDNLKQRTIALVSKLIETSAETDRMFYDSFFVRYAYRLFDGSYIKHSSPILFCPADHYTDMKTAFLSVNAGTQVISSTSYVTIKRFKLGIKVDTSFLSTWEDIIQSVDIFISPATGLSAVENTTIEDEAIPEGSPTAFPINKYTNESVFNSIKSESRFYNVVSLEHTANNFNFPASDAHRAKLTSLPFNENLPDDALFSHHKTGAKNGYTYNSRLHVNDLKVTMFKGFPLSMFKIKGDYMGESYLLSDVEKYAIKVYFNDPSINPVEVIVNNDQFSAGGSAGEAAISWFLSYPDSRAIRMELYSRIYDSVALTYIWEKTHTWNLIPHDILNLAYHLNWMVNIGIVVGEVVDTQVESTSSYARENQLRVSETNNPFLLNRAYDFDSKILNIRSNTIQSSDYSQFPLYVLTNNKIYAGQIGSGNVAYSNFVITSNQQPVSPVVAITPWGVVYVTKRGLKVIGDSGLLTEKNEESKRELFFTALSQPGDPFYSSITEDLKQTLKASDLMMCYDFTEDELLVRSKASNYTFVISREGMYVSDEKFTLIVENKPVLHVAESVQGDEIGIGDSFSGGTLACILTDQDDDYEDGKIKGFVVTPLTYNVNYDQAVESIPPGFELPTFRNVITIANGGLDMFINSRLWLQEGEEGPAIYDQSYNVIFSNDGSSQIEAVYVKLVDITTVQGLTTIKDYTQGSESAKVALTTRPLDFGTTLFKRLERALIRCRLIDAFYIRAMLHASNDGENFVAVKGFMLNNKTIGTSQVKPNNFKDIDLGMCPTKYKYYSVSLSGICDEKSRIEMIEAEVTQEYNNDKIR